MNGWTIDDIKAYCKQLSQKVDDDFDIPVKLNYRLSSTLGRVIMTPLMGGRYVPSRMEFASSIFDECSIETLKKIIEHEWCHYYVTKTTGGAHKHDAVFKQTCKAMGFALDKGSIYING